MSPSEKQTLVGFLHHMEYPEDRPFPSCLMLGYPMGRPIHVVAALDPDTGTCHVITAYEPDPAIWQPDFRARRLL